MANGTTGHEVAYWCMSLYQAERRYAEAQESGITGRALQWVTQDVRRTRARFQQVFRERYGRLPTPEDCRDGVLVVDEPQSDR